MEAARRKCFSTTIPWQFFPDSSSAPRDSAASGRLEDFLTRLLSPSLTRIRLLALFSLDEEASPSSRVGVTSKPISPALDKFAMCVADGHPARRGAAQKVFLGEIRASSISFSEIYLQQCHRYTRKAVLYRLASAAVQWCLSGCSSALQQPAAASPQVPPTSWVC